MTDAALRKRDRTRDKLLLAAQELMLECGLPAITINDIAARADVAPGTFYNYFRTREDVADTIADMLQRAYHRDVDAVTAGMDDPARIFAASLRQTLAWITPGGRLGKLMFASGVPLTRYAFGIRERAARDIRAGIAAGKFRVTDLMTMQSMMAGVVVGVSIDLYLGVLPPSAVTGVTEQCLLLLGVTPARARSIAQESLPLCAAPALPLSASELLAPIERTTTDAVATSVAAPAAAMTLGAPVSAAGPGRRPRASRSLRART